MTITWLCQCDSFKCSESVELPLDVAQRLYADGLILIADTCPIGPSPGDEVVEEGDGYKLVVSHA